MKKNTTAKREEAKRILPHLPDDIVDNILLLLHTTSIRRFSCVCKRWYELFRNPNFLNSRLKHSLESQSLNCFSIEYNHADRFYIHITKSASLYTLFEDGHCENAKMDSPIRDISLRIEIGCSHNGLILMRNIHLKKQIWLWNPYTTELKELFIPEVKFGLEDYHKMNRRYKTSVTHGVCYDSDTNDYDIVVATCYEMECARYICKIMVYTSNSKLWKTLPNSFPYKIRTAYGMAEVIFVCGAFHWIVRRSDPSKKRCIASFNIHGDNFSEVAITNLVDKLLNDKGDPDSALGVLGGCLCLLIKEYSSSYFEVWVKKDYNVTESWTKFFNVPLPATHESDIGYMKVLWEFKNGEVLLVTAEGSWDWNCFIVLYDPVSQKCKYTETQHKTLEGWNIEAFAERSLGSLNSINNCSGKKRPSSTQQGLKISTFG